MIVITITMIVIISIITAALYLAGRGDSCNIKITVHYTYHYISTGRDSTVQYSTVHITLIISTVLQGKSINLMRRNMKDRLAVESELLRKLAVFK